MIWLTKVMNVPRWSAIDTCRICRTLWSLRSRKERRLYCFLIDVVTGKCMNEWMVEYIGNAGNDLFRNSLYKEESVQHLLCALQSRRLKYLVRPNFIIWSTWMTLCWWVFWDFSKVRAVLANNTKLYSIRVDFYKKAFRRI